MIQPQYHFRRVGNDILIWDVRKLSKLAEPCRTFVVPLCDIKEIDEPYWYDATSGTPTCRSVLEHARQVSQSDLAYPILLCPQGRVVDGMHRVMKAVMMGDSTISARHLPELPKPDYVNRHPEDLPYGP